MKWLEIIRLIMEIIALLPKDVPADIVDRQLDALANQLQDELSANVMPNSLFDQLAPHIMEIIKILIEHYRNNR